MDHTPEKNYHPEDEYELLEFTPKQYIKKEAETADTPVDDAMTTQPEEPAVQDAAEEELPPYRTADDDSGQASPVTPAPQQPQTPQPQTPLAGTPVGVGAPMTYYPYYYPQTPPPAQQPMPFYPYPPYMPMVPMMPQQGQLPAQPVPPPPPAPTVQPNPYNAPTGASSVAPTTAPASDTQQPTTEEKPSGEKPVTPLGTKVFIIILCALMAAMIIGFSVYISLLPKPDKSKSGDNDDPSSQNNFGYYYPEDIYSSSGEFTEVEDEISLVEDKGETQNREDNNPASVGTPDESAKSIRVEEQPADKDKDSDKYTTQSAYDSVCDSVVTVLCYQDHISDKTSDIMSQGTGTVISSDGYLVTNAHVIGNSKAFVVNIVFNNGDKYQAQIIGYDSWSDLAVLKIDATGLKAVTFGDSDKLAIGDDVITVGSPGGEKFKNSLTKGIVSAFDRELSVNKYVRYIQSDAAISPGNSGGPLCNIYGQVVGITTAKAVADYYENMSFSIPSRTVEEIVNDLMHYGYVKNRVRIGLTGTEVSAEGVAYYNTPAGIIISGIDENGSLADSDIQVGDILTELDGNAITSFQDVYDVLADHKPGDKVSIKVQRPED